MEPEQPAEVVFELTEFLAKQTNELFLADLAVDEDVLKFLLVHTIDVHLVPDGMLCCAPVLAQSWRSTNTGVSEA